MQRSLFQLTSCERPKSVSRSKFQKIQFFTYAKRYGLNLISFTGATGFWKLPQGIRIRLGKHFVPTGDNKTSQKTKNFGQIFRKILKKFMKICGKSHSVENLKESDARKTFYFF